MMKPRMFKGVARLAAVTLLAASASLAHAKNTVTVRYSSWVPINHWYMTDILLPYLERIEQITEGRVKVDILPKSVGTPQAQYDVVRDGLADMAWAIIDYTPGRFRLGEMGTLPFMGADKVEAVVAFSEFYEEHLAQYDEFKGVEVMAVYPTLSGHVATRGRPIHTLDDFKGLKLRSASKVATDILSTLGAVPILKSAAEVYEMLSTGAIDGSLMIPETVVSQNAVGLLDTFSLIPEGFFQTVHVIAINPRTWARISPEDQQAILAMSKATLPRSAGEAYAARNAEAFEAMKKAGYNIHTISPELLSELKQRLKPLEDQWVKDAAAKGVKDPEALLEAFRARLAEL